MSHRTGTQRRTWKERVLSLLLSAALVVGLAPGLTLPASAEHWADTYLDQLVDWGVMRADQTANPDAALTRAEFFAIINRAYGYNERGYIPFEDVLPTDWFYDDISIAYTAGYMAGTSATTASPNDTLTREQAFCILGRNMMLKDAPGESLAFADSRDVSDWARGTIKAAADNYIVTGFPDNTLHPKDSISKGQMAVLISQCLGNPVRQSGTYDLGGVFGNVTITAPNVTLRNTTISGDLYISGGVGLGGIKLENVDVLGRIIVSGTGESEGGDASVIMRNVTAEEMLVDNMRNKTVTIRADGITDIAKTVVRTNAYLEDNNTDDKGLMHIELDGDPGIRLTLAGRIKEVVDKTPSSYIQVAKGTVAKLTVDEAATNSTVQIDRNAKVTEMNLDVATSVLGDGDIGQLNINAPGSVVTMLPDKIYIRPGLTASIAGVIMDYQAAEEGSLDPRLLSGYPAAKDIAPTGFRADFASNKKGTIYWAVSYVSDGSIGEDDLISPPSYGSKAIANGNLAAPTGGDEVSAQVGNLVVGGSYYLSAIVVDEQKNRSPVKVISFSTPDNTVPAFGQGYPYMSRTTCGVSQVTVMPTKSCKLYYALLPQGAKAPTANELKAAAVTGNLGYGVRDVIKNTEDVFTVNSQRLEELKTYVLYLWLTDVDGANSSAVQVLTFTIPDETPPEFMVHPHMNGNPLATSIPMAATVNEDATIFWAVVEEGVPYPLPNHNSTDPMENVTDSSGAVISSSLTSDYAKLCVTSGMGALQRGQVAARANTEVTFNITGLLAEKAYDFYYLARDTAGNYTLQVYKLQGGLHTLDTSGPVVVQSFNLVPSAEAPNNPLSSTDIVLDFSENVRSNKVHIDKDFLTLYNESKDNLKAFTDTLAASIVLFHLDPDSQQGGEVPIRGSWGSNDPEPMQWIDYSNVVIRMAEEGHIQVVFPGTGGSDHPAVKLANGEKYYFEFRNLVDTSSASNPMSRYNNAELNYSKLTTGDQHVIPVFETVFSQVLMRRTGVSDLPDWKSGIDSGKLDPTSNLARADATFRLSPQSTKNTDASNKFDILIYTDTSIEFDLYYRITDKSGKGIIAEGTNIPEESAAYAPNLLKDYTNKTGPDSKGWYFLGSAKDVWGGRGVSVGKDFNGCQNNPDRDYPSLKDFSEDVYYEFVISITKNGTQTKHENFSDPVKLDVYIEAGDRTPIHELASTPSLRESKETALDRGVGVTNIGLEPNSGAKHLELDILFTNTKAPEFQNSRPIFSVDDTASTQTIVTAPTGGAETNTSVVGDTFAYVSVNLDVKGTIYYVVSNVAQGLPPTLEWTSGTATQSVSGAAAWQYIPTHGTDTARQSPIAETTPRAGRLAEGVTLTSPAIITVAENSDLPNNVAVTKGSELYPVAGSDQNIFVSGLKSDTTYYIYFVLESEKIGNAPGQRSQVYVYKFKTAKTTAPRIRLNPSSSGTIQVRTDYGDSNERSVEADLTWRLLQSQAAGDVFKKAGSFTFPKLANDSPIKQYYLPSPPPDGTSAVDPGLEGVGGFGVDTLYEALILEYDTLDVFGSSVPSTEEYNENYNGYTLFDLFASSTNRTDVQDIIDYRGGSLGYFEQLNNDDASTRRTGNFRTPVEWISGPNKNIADPESGVYLFLISGHNIGSSTGTSDWSSVNSFRLLDNVRYGNTDAPKLADQPLGVQATFSVDKTGTPTLTANISLRFNKALYWKYDFDSKWYKVVTNKAGSLDPDTNGVDILYGVSLNPGDGVTPTASGSDQQFNLKFSGITSTTSYFTVLGTGGRIAANGGDTAEPILITVIYTEESVTNSDGSTSLYWNVTGSVTYNGQTVPLSQRILVSTTGGAPSQLPTLLSVSGKDVNEGAANADGEYTVDVTLTFDSTVYFKDEYGPRDTSTLLISPSSPMPNRTTVDSMSSPDKRTFYFTIHQMKAGQSGKFTLMGVPICSANGQANTSTPAIEIELKMTSGSNEAGLPLTQYRIVVTYNGTPKETIDIPVTRPT